MPRALRSGLLVVFAILASVRPLTATEEPQSSRDLLFARMSDIGQRVIALAEQFPEDKYEYRPAPGVRTFSEQLRHVAFWNLWAVKTARGEPMDTAPNELSKVEYPTKASIVTALKSAAAAAEAELTRQPATPSLPHTSMALSFTSHSCEHYGQLVMYYRLNGLVPPASRGSDKP